MTSVQRKEFWGRSPDYFTHGYGGSSFVLIVNCQEVYDALVEAGVAVNVDDFGLGPEVRLNYPTMTNSQWASKPYNKVFEALKDFTGEELHQNNHTPYPIMESNLTAN